jgi:LacI family transcriptional regulator
MRNSRTREVTLRDVARAAGVHYSTASRSLDPINVRLINPATVVRVQQAAQELGYRPDLVARGLRRGRTGTIGIVVADLANPYIAPVLRGIAESLESRGVMPLIVETLDDQARLKRLLATLLSRRIDAIITSAARRGYADILTEVANAGTPVVLAVRDLANSGLPVVTHDDLRGGELAARHLIELGHRRLTQLRGPSDIQSFSDRGEGFERYARSVRAAVVGVTEMARTPDVAEGRRLMERVLAEVKPLPTGIFAHNDLMAVGALEALDTAGLRCPEDVSLVGYNDVQLASHIAPPLTTIRLPGEALGRIAGEMALGLLDQPDVRPASVSLPPTLVPRGSTAPMRYAMAV